MEMSASGKSEFGKFLFWPFSLVFKTELCPWKSDMKASLLSHYFAFIIFFLVILNFNSLCWMSLGKWLLGKKVKRPRFKIRGRWEYLKLFIHAPLPFLQSLIFLFPCKAFVLVILKLFLQLNSFSCLHAALLFRWMQ